MRRIWLACCLALALVSGRVSAEDGSGAAAPAPPATPPAVADAVLRCAEGKDAQGLARLAGATVVDPWLVADELCARGAFDAAELYARAAPAARSGGAAEFVARQRTKPSDPARRAALRDAAAARTAGRPADALRLLDAAGAPHDDVVSIRLQHERALDVAALGDLRTAMRALEDLASKAEAMGWPLRQALLLEYAANQADALDDSAEALRLTGRQVAILRAAGAGHDEGMALQSLARFEYRRGRAGEALATMRRAIPLALAQSDAATKGRLLSALALYEDAAGDLASAAVHHEEALRLFEGTSDGEGRVLALMNASRTFRAMKDLPGAIALVDRALADPLFAAGATSPLAGQLLLNRAEYRTSADDLDRALADLDLARAAFDAANARQWQARAAAQRGNVLRLRGDVAGAERTWREQFEIARQLGHHGLAAAAQVCLGDAANDRGDGTEARRSWEAALADAEAAGSANLEVLCLGRIAEDLFRRGRAADALAPARRAVLLEARSVQGLGSDEASRLVSGGGVWQVGLDAARAVGDLGAWFEFAEAGRAGALAESVGGRAAIRAAEVSESLTAEAESATSELAAAAEAATNARATGDLAATRAATTRESASRERLRVVQDRIERRRKLAAGLSSPAPPALAEVQRRLGPSRALVVFHLGGSRAEALLVTAAAARLCDLGDGPKFAERCTSLTSGSEFTEIAVESVRAATLGALALPTEVRTVLVVPAGPVAQVPFALLDPGRDIVIVPSALVWTLLDAEGRERGSGVLAIGDPDTTGTRFAPLPSTRAEATAVGSRVLVGKEATEAALRRTLVESSRWHAVHFACHGAVDPRQASLSGLALTRAAPDDGMFTAREILGVPIPADVAVLSACEAGRPGASAGDAVSAATGLPPAFLAAGCPRVVANLWKVDDEAGRVFSIAFHAAWAKDGSTAVGAMRAGRAAVRADPRFAAPRHWAGWILWGLAD